MEPEETPTQFSAREHADKIRRLLTASEQHLSTAGEFLTEENQNTFEFHVALANTCAVLASAYGHLATVEALVLQEETLNAMHESYADLLEQGKIIPLSEARRNVQTGEMTPSTSVPATSVSEPSSRLSDYFSTLPAGTKLKLVLSEDGTFGIVYDKDTDEELVRINSSASGIKNPEMFMRATAKKNDLVLEVPARRLKSKVKT